MNFYSKTKIFFTTLIANVLQDIKEDGGDTVALQSMLSPEKIQLMRKKLAQKTKASSAFCENLDANLNPVTLSSYPISQPK